MANPLTGDYDAVVQIAIRQINGLLATLHQNGEFDTAPIKLLHSTSVRIGDPRGPFDHDFGDWVLEFQKTGQPRGVRDVGAKLTATSPPGVAKLLTDAIADLADRVIEIPPRVVRGLAKVQVSSLTLHIPPGSTSEVSVHAQVRAHYYPDPGTTNLPAPLHGEVRVGFEIRQVAVPPGTRLVVKPSGVDSRILFIAAPGSGLSLADESRISAEMRKVVRHDIEILPVDLPAGFPFAEFKGIGSGSHPALALPLMLSGAALPFNKLHTITQPVIGSSGFAFAVSKEFVTSLIDVEKIRTEVNNQPPFRKLGARYRLEFTQGPTLTFHAGSIELSGRVDAKTKAIWAPNGFVSFKQQLGLRLNASTQTVTLRRVGAPDVDESWFLSHDWAVNLVRAEIENALAANADQVRSVFEDARADLVGGLGDFKAGASAEYTSVEITQDGIIVRGEISGPQRRSPIVEVAETDQNTAFTAFKSWIPGGRITRFIWSWVENGSPQQNMLGGVEKSFVDEHRFIFPKPAAITDLSRICLRIEGTQTLANGQEVTTAAGTTCEAQGPVLELDVPSWWEPLTLPIWMPDLADDVVVRDAVAGHVSVPAVRPRQSDEPGAHALVYFADWRVDQPLATLGAALTQARLARPLEVIVVVPAGAFDQRRREFEAKLMSQRFPARVHVTEDDEGGWTRTFAVTKTPSVFLINARREFVWKHEGDPAPAALADALYKHVVPTSDPRLQRLRLTVAPGERAPNVVFEDDRGNGGALHRLRGRRVLMTFFQSWSAPCQKELQRLETLCATGKDAPFVVAFHGGKNGKGLSEIRKRLGISFGLVQDSEHRIARTYGVRCWPTTITIGREGDVEHVQMGVAHEHERAKGV